MARIQEVPLLDDVAPPREVDVAGLGYDPAIRPTMPEELVYADLFDLYDAAVARELSRTPTRWYASSIAICPRLVWYRMKGAPLPHDLTSWARMRIGSTIEGLEEALLEMAIPGTNTKTIRDVLPQYPRLAAAVEGALAARYVRDGEEAIRFDPANIKDHYILQLPFTLQVPQLKMPIAMKTDAVVLLRDQPVILEIKSSYGRGIKHARQAAATGEGLRTSWVVQVALYTVALGLPAKIHAWSRDDIYRTEFNAFWREGSFRIHGWPVEINGLNPVEWAIERFRWYEELIKQDEPPGDIAWDDEHQRWVLDIDIPPRARRPDEGYSLLVSKGSMPQRYRGSKKAGNYIKSQWCYTCEARSLCYKGLLKEEA